MTLSMGTAEAFFWKKGGFRMGHCRRKRLRKSGVHIYICIMSLFRKNTPQGYHTNQRLIYLKVLLKPARGIKPPIVDTL